ncbi:MAG: hypothetical protein IJ194_00830 [Bacilli bacterium]|nr:hypothetical protein [Bacilli bacterium]
MSVNNITIDQDIVDSLRGLYFGSVVDKFTATVNRAYRDFNRTLLFGETTKEKRMDLRERAKAYLEEGFDSLDQIHTQKDFDAWHKKLGNKLISLYASVGITFTYGQAQKWINMTAKYLYLIGAYTFDEVFPYLHVPIDNYVMDIAEEKFKLEKPELPWSQWDYEEYKNYQLAIRKLIQAKGLDPLRWEFRNWLESARGFEN